MGADRLPFRSRCLNRTELTLAFFMAHLILKPSIKVGTTILNYETHVKYWFREEGCMEESYSTPFLRQIRQGVQKTLPSRADDRRALLLPTMIKNPEFRIVTKQADILFRFATIIGFIGMLRPHTLDQLDPDSFFMILNNRRCIRMHGSGHIFREKMEGLRQRYRIIGFYIQFDSKTMNRARAYFPSLCSRTRTTTLEPMCHVRALIEV